MSIVTFPCLTYYTVAIGLEKREAEMIKKAFGDGGNGAEC